MLWADRLLSLVTFFAAAKKVTAAPHRGNANKPNAKQASWKPETPEGVQPPPPQAKKVTAAPHRGKANRPKAHEQNDNLNRPMVFNPSAPSQTQSSRTTHTPP
jgi:hypothetical protein